MFYCTFLSKNTLKIDKNRAKVHFIFVKKCCIKSKNVIE